MSFAEKIFNTYEGFKNQEFQKRYFGLDFFYEQLEKVRAHSKVESSLAGYSSVYNKPIYLLKIGRGPQKIMLWSQMHGDEPTATMALFDIFSFLLEEKNDECSQVRNVILAQCSIYFIPVLNPDGTMLWTRRNAQGIDINRDALRTQSTEGQLLKKLQKDIKPAFSFNLHDQLQHWAAGNSPRQAKVSFLATAYNQAREINEVRSRAMKLVVLMNRALCQFIPGHIGRFSDEFEPRAFGDNIQKWGSSLVLLEAGGNGTDLERQEVRKLNVTALLVAFEAITTQHYQTENLEAYFEIPENQKVLLDLIIRNASIQVGQSTLQVDIGIIRQSELTIEGNLVETYSIDDLGDLSTFYGIDEFDAKGYTYESELSPSIGDRAVFNIKDNNNKILFEISADGWQIHE